MKRKIFLLLFTFVACGKSPEKASFVPNVVVKKAEAKKIPITIDAIGHCVPYNSVEIKAQVEGRLLEVNYTQGKEVQEGDLLLKIDPRPYEAERDRAVAIRAQDAAKLRFAADRVARYEKLVPENYVSALDYTQYVSDLGSYEAAVMAADAAVRLAEIELDYCYIRAPFTGIAGKKLVDIGNLITNNGDTLVTINQIDPVYLDFSVPEKDFLKLMHYQKERDLDVSILLGEKSYTAKLTVVDNKINPKTGMIPLRAEMANKEKIFWPGQFVKAKVVLKYVEDAVMIPVEGQNIGQQGLYTFIINQGNVAEYRLIKTGEQVGNFIQILDGVRAGERVVIRGQLDVEPGLKVSAREES